MRRIILSASLLAIGCEQSAVEPFEVAALSPSLLLPGDTVSATIQGSGAAISIDYSQGETTAEWATAELLGGPTAVQLTLDPIADSRYDAILPANLDHPSDAYRIALHGRDKTFDFPVRILDLDAQLSGCPTEKARPLTIALLDTQGARIAPDHPIEVRFSGTAEVLDSECNGRAPLPGSLGPAAALDYCVLAGNDATLTVEAGSLSKTIELGSLSVSPSIGPVHVTAGECVPLAVACPECAAAMPLEITIVKDGAPSDAQVFSDAKCTTRATLGNQGANALFLRAPVSLDGARLQVVFRGCETRLNVEIVVHPRLITIPIVAAGVPFPVQIPSGCGAVSAVGDVVLTSQPQQWVTDRFYTAAPAASAVDRFRIKCDAGTTSYLSLPIELSVCDAPTPLGRLELEPAAIAASSTASHVRFHFNRLAPGVPAASQLSATVLSPSGAEALIYDPPVETCGSELCVGVDYLGGGNARPERPELIATAAYLYDTHGCVSVHERTLIRAVDERSIFRFRGNNALSQVMQFIEARAQGEMPVLAFARGANLVVTDGIMFSQPIYIAGDGARLTVGAITFDDGTAGSFVSGLAVQSDRVELKGNEIVWRDGEFAPGPDGQSSIRVGIYGERIDFGPGILVRAEGAAIGVASYGVEARLHRVEIVGGDVGLDLGEPAEIDQLVIAGSLHRALVFEPSEPAQTRSVFNHLTIDTAGIAFDVGGPMTIAGSIVRAQALTPPKPPFPITFDGSWTDPPPANGSIVGAPPRIVPAVVFVAPNQGDYRPKPGSYPIDGVVGTTLNLDLNGVLPGSFNGARADLGALESIYSPP